MNRRTKIQTRIEDFCAKPACILSYHNLLNIELENFIDKFDRTHVVTNNSTRNVVNRDIGRWTKSELDRFNGLCLFEKSAK